MDISVIIINYNTVDLVAKNLDGLLRQKNSDFEVFIIDNVSNDNCAEVLSEFEKKITLIQNSKA